MMEPRRRTAQPENDSPDSLQCASGRNDIIGLTIVLYRTAPVDLGVSAAEHKSDDAETGNNA